MSKAAEIILSRCHPSCRTCTGECLLLQQLDVNGLALVELKAASPGALIPFACTACGLCSVACNRKLDPAALLRDWRSEAAGIAGLPPGLGLRLTDQPDHLYVRYRRADGRQTGFPEAVAAETVFFPGCALSAFTPELAHRVYAGLQDRFPAIGWLESCCYDLLDGLGLNERYAQAQQSLAKETDRRGVRRIITACPTCHYRLKQAFPALEVLSIYQLLCAERRTVSGLPARIAVHDSCADRMTQDLGRAVRTLLPPVERLKHEGKRSLCCGAGGGVELTHPELAAAAARRHTAEVAATGAQLLVTYCTRCAVQLAQSAPEIPIVHILDLIFGLEQDYTHIAAEIYSFVGETNG